NQQWNNHLDAIPTQASIAFASDLDRIQYHLYHVISYLTKNNLPTDQSMLENRLSLLSELKTYTDKKVFPTNLYHRERTPYFIDDNGVHCAVGYMIKVSGNQSLANKISAEHNYDYLKDIKTPGVTDWAKTYGFTLDELAWIQPGYLHADLTLITRFSGGWARGSFVDQDNNALITFGSFDSVDNRPSPPIIIYQNNELRSFSELINGDINDASGSLHDLVVVGEIIGGDTTVPLAHFKNETWSYFKSPNPELPIGLKIFRVSQNDLYLTISNGFSDDYINELWRLDLSTGRFQKILSCLGAINTIIDSKNGLIIGGRMVQSVSFKDTTERPLGHAVLLRYYKDTWDILLKPTELIRTVTSSILKDSTVYLGLTGYYYNDKPSDMLGYYDLKNGIYTKLLDRLDVNYDLYNPINDSVFVVKSLSFYQSRDLMVGGIFEYSDLMSQSKNQLRYDILEKKIHPTINFNQGGSVVNGMHYLSDSLLIMTTNNRLQKFKYSVGLPVVKSFDITISPNPFTSTVTVEGVDEIQFTYDLIDLSGRIIQSGKTQTNSIGFDSHINSGLYTLLIQTLEGQYTQKVIKN
ncbi:MAG: hypothetical protein ACI9JN_001807, partial [Bacteroidia bacterium]